MGDSGASRDKSEVVDPEGRSLEDPSSTLGYAQCRDVEQSEHLHGRDCDSPSDASTQHDPERDLEKNESGREGDDDLSGTMAGSSSDSNKTDVDALARTMTAIHGKDESGRYIISWNGPDDPENPYVPFPSVLSLSNSGYGC